MLAKYYIDGISTFKIELQIYSEYDTLGFGVWGLGFGDRKSVV